MKNLKKDPQSVSKQLNALSGKVEKMVAAVGKPEKPKAAKAKPVKKAVIKFNVIRNASDHTAS